MTAAVRAGATAILLLILQSAAAESTAVASRSPIGSAYRERVIAIVGDTWSKSVLRRSTGLSAGTVRLEFDIMSSGTPTNVRVHARRHDKASADLLRDMLRRTTFPRIPAELLRELPDRRMAVDFNFTLRPPSDAQEKSNTDVVRYVPGPEPAASERFNKRWQSIFVYTPAPEDAHDLRYVTTQGRVRISVNEQGKVTAVRVLETTGVRRFDEGAVEAFSRWRAKPGPRREVDMPLTFVTRGRKPPVATEG